MRRLAVGGGTVLVLLLALALGLAACGGNPPPELCPKPPPPGEPTIIWRGDDQVELSWDDMPVVVCEGEDIQARILQRQIVLRLDEPRTPVSLDSFCGFDRGDTVEADVSFYDDQNRVLYRRSLHLEGGVPECYDAFEPRPSLSVLPTSRITMVATCRANGPNEVTGNLWARCHLMGSVIFDGGEPPPPPSCNIPGANDPDWKLLTQPRSTWEQLNAAKIAVGDRTGKDPLETLALLAQAVRDAGGCAVSPWDDEFAIEADSLSSREAQAERARCTEVEDGTMVVDGYHAVAFTNGGYVSNPKGDAWAYGGVSCRPPIPPPLARAKVKLHQTEPKRTYDRAFLVKDADYCREIGYTDGRLYCTVRPDGHPERDACETLRVGTPRWSHTQGTCWVRDNGMYRCNDDAAGGEVTVCAEKAPLVCASMEVE